MAHLPGEFFVAARVLNISVRVRADTERTGHVSGWEGGPAPGIFRPAQSRSGALERVETPAEDVVLRLQLVRQLVSGSGVRLRGPARLHAEDRPDLVELALHLGDEVVFELALDGERAEEAAEAGEAFVKGLDFAVVFRLSARGRVCLCSELALDVGELFSESLISLQLLLLVVLEERELIYHEFDVFYQK